MRGKADTPNTNITRSLFGAIMAISVPAIVTNVTVPVLGITDVAIAGHLGSTVSLAAIAVGTNMFNLLYWLFNFLRMGSSGLTAQAYGSGNSKAAAAVLCRAVLIALGVGSAMIIFRSQLCTLLLDSMDVTGATRDAAECYFMIRVWAAPATLGAFAFTGWFVGMQNSRVTMWISLFVNVLNIAFRFIAKKRLISPQFIISPKHGMCGLNLSAQTVTDKAIPPHWAITVPAASPSSAIP